MWTKVNLVFAVVIAPVFSAAISGGCYYLPDDEGWPSASKWAELNATVGGRLIQTVPIGSVCHDPWYDEAACSTLRANWTDPGVQ